MFTCKGINPGCTPGPEPRPALQSTNLYICIVPLKFMNFCVLFFCKRGGRESKTVPLPPESPSFIAAFLSPCNPPCCWTGSKHKLHQSSPKKRFPVLCAQRQGDNQTHHRRAKMCTKMCATVRAGGGKQSWCAVTLQREGPSCAPDYGPFDSGGK